MELLSETVFGNPHSVNPTSSATTEPRRAGARAAVLRLLQCLPGRVHLRSSRRTPPVRCGSSARRTRSRPGDRFLAHRSTTTTRSTASASSRGRRARRRAYVPIVAPDLRVDEGVLHRYLDETRGSTPQSLRVSRRSRTSPACSTRSSGSRTRRSTAGTCSLDCAAFVPTNRLDLGRWHPDFVPISFYKLFGYPTGVGALLARQDALAKLRTAVVLRRHVVAVECRATGHRPTDGFAAFEDGTVNYLDLPAIEIGLRAHRADRHRHDPRACRALGAWLLEALQALRHCDGSPAVEVYGPTDVDRRGGTIAFNFLHPSGRVIDERFVDQIAAAPYRLGADRAASATRARASLRSRSRRTR